MWALPAQNSVSAVPRALAGTGFRSILTSGSSRWRPRSRCMKKGMSPGWILYSRWRVSSKWVRVLSTAPSLLIADRTVSTSRCPAESSSSSRSPSARPPSGPGFRAFMNIGVIDTGPDISMPGLRSSAGTAGTCQSPVVISLSGSGPGIPFRLIALSRTLARLARSSWIRGVNRSCRASRYSMNSGVKTSLAPTTLPTVVLFFVAAICEKPPDAGLLVPILGAQPTTSMADRSNGPCMGGNWCLPGKRGQLQRFRV